MIRNQKKESFFFFRKKIFSKESFFFSRKKIFSKDSFSVERKKNFSKESFFFFQKKIFSKESFFFFRKKIFSKDSFSDKMKKDFQNLISWREFLPTPGPYPDQSWERTPSLNHLETQTVTLIKSDSKYPPLLMLSNKLSPSMSFFLSFRRKIIVFLTWIITT